MKKLGVFLLPFALSACANEFSKLDIGNISSKKAQPAQVKEEIIVPEKRFTITQLSSLQIGLVSNEVKEILGEPDDISKQTCGKDGFFYKCTIWRYQGANKIPVNLFFNGDFKSLYLIKFDKRELGELINN